VTFRIDKYCVINRELTMALMRLIVIKYFNHLTAQTKMFFLAIIFDQNAKNAHRPKSGLTQHTQWWIPTPQVLLIFNSDHGTPRAPHTVCL